jgi:signal transduction histidine kinase
VFRRKRSVVQAGDGAKWLTEQLETDFDPTKLMMAPLNMGDEVVGVLVFEQLIPVEENVETDRTPLSCQVAASVIAMAQAGRKHELLSERFVQVMSSLRQARAQLARQQSLAGLAEMAAGAAHELNNPLSVISGRAQLLMSAEDDADKKQMLNQIQQRAAEITHIVSDLLSFARPASPEKRSVSVQDVIEAAIESVCSQLGLQYMEVDISGEAVEDGVYVDVHQATQSIATVLVNALQSYKGGGGPVWVTCEKSPMSNAVWVAIRDAGRGMDAETLKHACQPFYSGHPAGRRRGMGLAHAQRLLLLNGGDLKITSEPGQGTTVTVILPKV